MLTFLIHLLKVQFNQPESSDVIILPKQPQVIAKQFLYRNLKTPHF